MLTLASVRMKVFGNHFFCFVNSRGSPVMGLYKGCDHIAFAAIASCDACFAAQQII